MCYSYNMTSLYPCIVVESKLHTNPYHFLMMAACVACVKTFYQRSFIGKHRGCVHMHVCYRQCDERRVHITHNIYTTH